MGSRLVDAGEPIEIAVLAEVLCDSGGLTLCRHHRCAAAERLHDLGAASLVHRSRQFSGRGRCGVRETAADRRGENECREHGRTFRVSRGGQARGRPDAEQEGRERRRPRGQRTRCMGYWTKTAVVRAGTENVPEALSKRAPSTVVSALCCWTECSCIVAPANALTVKVWAVLFALTSTTTCA